MSETNPKPKRPEWKVFIQYAWQQPESLKEIEDQVTRLYLSGYNLVSSKFTPLGDCVLVYMLFKLPEAQQ